jgi:antirestriction protein ArdC
MTNATAKKNNFKPNPEYKRRDLYQEVTDKIVKQLEKGTAPWLKPWRTNANDTSFQLPKNYTTDNHYRGVNIVLLWASSLENNFTSNEWASYKQWQSKDEAVRKDEKGSMIVYFDTIEREEEGELKKIPFLKQSVVFNRNQLVSYDPEKEIVPVESKSLVERIDYVDEFISNTKAIIDHRSDKACYSPLSDRISMPKKESFIDTAHCSATEGYYSTLMHELTHWTGHTSRLDRKFGKRFGDLPYAAEELVAELGAAFTCTEFEISRPSKENHASYIDYWLKVLKDNKYFLIGAASEASKASAYLHSLQPK